MSEETLKILEPIFLLLNETKGEMELEEFYLCFLKILNTLCWAEKNELFDNFEESKKIKNNDNLQNCPFMV